MLSSQTKKIIGLSGAIIIFVMGIFVLTLVEPFGQQWYVGFIFVIISIVYFIIAVFLKSRKK